MRRPLHGALLPMLLLLAVPGPRFSDGDALRNCNATAECASACLQADGDAAMCKTVAVCQEGWNMCACMPMAGTATNYSGAVLRSNGACEAKPPQPDGNDACTPVKFPHRVKIILAVKPSPELGAQHLNEGRASAALLTVLRLCVAEAVGCEAKDVGALIPPLTAGASRETSLLGGSSSQEAVLWTDVEFDFCVAISAGVFRVDSEEFSTKFVTKAQDFALLSRGGTVVVSRVELAWPTTTTTTTSGPAASASNSGVIVDPDEASSGGGRGDTSSENAIGDFWWVFLLLGFVCLVVLLCLVLHLLWLRHRGGRKSLPECLAKRLDTWYATKTKVYIIEETSQLDRSLTDEDVELQEDDNVGSGTFRPGQVVVIQDLASAAELNGQEGQLERWDRSAGRWHVRLKGQREVKALRATNLKAVEPKVEKSGKPGPRKADSLSSSALSHDNGGSGTPVMTTPVGTPRGSAAQEAAVEGGSKPAHLGGLPGQLSDEPEPPSLTSKTPVVPLEAPFHLHRDASLYSFSDDGCKDVGDAYGNSAAVSFAAKGPSPSFSEENAPAVSAAAAFAVQGPSPSFSDMGAVAVSETAPTEGTRLQRAPSFSDCLEDAASAPVGLALAGSTRSTSSPCTGAASVADSAVTMAGGSIQRAPSFSDCFEETARAEPQRAPSFSDCLEETAMAEPQRHSSVDDGSIVSIPSPPGGIEGATVKRATATIEPTPSFGEEVEELGELKRESSKTSVRSTPSFS